MVGADCGCVEAADRWASIGTSTSRVPQNLPIVSRNLSPYFCSQTSDTPSTVFILSRVCGLYKKAKTLKKLNKGQLGDIIFQLFHDCLVYLVLPSYFSPSIRTEPWPGRQAVRCCTREMEQSARLSPSHCETPADAGIIHSVGIYTHKTLILYHILRPHYLSGNSFLDFIPYLHRKVLQCIYSIKTPELVSNL